MARATDDMDVSWDMNYIKKPKGVTGDLNEMPVGYNIFDQGPAPIDMEYKAPTTTGYPGDKP